MPEFLVHEALLGVVPGESEPSSLPTQSVSYINGNVSAEAVLIRTLLGTTTIEHVRTGLRFRSSANYSILGAPQSGAQTKQDLEALLTGADIDRGALNTHLRRNLKQNGFYSEVTGEILHVLWRSKRNEHTLAFLHLYRFMERISFAFPLLYAARTLDFKNAYTELKKFIETAEADHKFFRKFSETAIDDQLVSSSSTLDFTSAPTEYRSNCFKTVRKFIQNADITSEVPDQEIDVRNGALLDLLVTLRNRFFHFSSQHPNNISCLEIQDPDVLFECMNEVFLNWLSIIYFQVLAHYTTV